MPTLARLRFARAVSAVLVAPWAQGQPELPITVTGVTAHRGDSGAYVENTQPAFATALDLFE